jgi:hypothetical protein
MMARMRHGASSRQRSALDMLGTLLGHYKRKWLPLPRLSQTSNAALLDSATRTQCMSLALLIVDDYLLHRSEGA